MQAPKVGSVFVTDAGQQFCIAHVSPHDLSDPDVDPSSFHVFIVSGTDPNAFGRDEKDFTSEEFEQWCEFYGVSF